MQGRELTAEVQGSSLANLGEHTVLAIMKHMFECNPIAAYMMSCTTGSLADMFTPTQQESFKNLPLKLVFEAGEWAQSDLSMRQALELISFMPTLMFQTGRVINAVGELITASPLEYVFETGNVYLQQEFKRLAAY